MNNSNKNRDKIWYRATHAYKRRVVDYVSLQYLVLVMVVMLIASIIEGVLL